MRTGTWLACLGMTAWLGGCSGTTVLATAAGGQMNAGGDANGGRASMGGGGASAGAPDSTAGGGQISGGGSGGAPVVGGAGAAGAAGVMVTPIETVDDQKQSDKLDVLFVVDNSVSMGDKQGILAHSVQAFVNRLVNPRCLDAQGKAVATQPTSGAEACPTGTREFTPVKDMHLGAITSSLGAHGGSVCATPSSATDHLDDKAQLVATLRDAVPTYNDSGFLSFDTTGTAGITSPATLTTQLSTMISAVGEHGCGYEATLEAMYRFLIDPKPPESVDLVAQMSTPTGLNQTVLDQRAAFLRPDSSLAIVILSDENDCSITDSGVGWFVGSTSRMPRATAACATDESDPCCRSCAQREAAPPTGCVALADDPVCKTVTAGQPYATWDNLHDSLNLRCFDQKGRFGFDLLNPVERYIAGLTNAHVYSSDNQLLPNPLFAARGGKGPRSNSLVSLSVIVGAPWQDLATTSSLTAGDLQYLDAADLESAKRFPMLLGATSSSPPTDPLMIESTDQRSGKSPLTNAPIVNASSTNPLANPSNGHEQNIPDLADLQYACTFPLPAPKTCMNGDSACDCSPDKTGNADFVTAANSPLCQPPGGGAPATTQYFGKGYPGARQLRVAHALGERSAYASVCPKDTSDPASQGYGYVPALNALIDRIAVTLK